ncbi:MAG: bacteriohopanetetrol glucosamine biosynthesis glycosyltransferase HpnI [Terriglobales bacterium]
MTALLWLAVAGLVGSGAYLALVLLAARRFKSKKSVDCAAAWPRVSLLKPLCGDEPRLRENLESFFRLCYPEFEIIFGARNESDPALRVVRELRREYPEVSVSVVLSGEPDRPNAKVCALEQMVREAAYEYLIISDSDVEVEPGYIQAVIEPLFDPSVGLVTCLYRGVPTGGLWSRLEALGMSVEMTSGVILAEMLEGMKFALGPTMATRKDVLDRIGGIGRLAHYCSDDYVLGQRVAEEGFAVHLSKHVIDHVAMNRGLRKSVLHQVRWMKSTRCSRPLGHVGTGLTFAMPFALLGFCTALASGHSGWAWTMLAMGIANRVIEAYVVGWGVVRDRGALRYGWLYPARDLLGFVFWAWSMLGSRTIVWRDRRYQLLPGGEMLPDEAMALEPESQGAPEPQAVELSQ